MRLSGPDSRRIARRTVPLILLLAAACTGAPATDMETRAAAERSSLVILVFDRSTSIPDHTLTLAADLANQRLEQLAYGDRIAAMQLLQLSLEEPPRRWSQQVPERQFPDQNVASDSASRARFIQDAKAYLRVFSDPADRGNIDGTDLLSTMHDVGEELRAYADHNATLYLFSDMLQSNRSIDFEGLRMMPAADWIDDAQSKGLLPDLAGLCVVVVGARVDTESSQRVKRFWSDYFTATGAQLMDHNYMLRPVKLPVNPCPAGSLTG
jgi:hypothetical protein